MPCNPLRCECGKIYLPQRFVMVILISLALTISFVQRESFGIVVGHLGFSPLNISKSLDKSPCGGMIEDLFKDRLNEWQQLPQALLIGSFIIGYVVMLLPSGFIADKFGGRLVCTVALFAGSLITAVNPFIIKRGFFWLVCFGRAVVGASNACLLTAAVTLISRWVPKPEQSSVCGAVFSCHAIAMLFVNINYILLDKSIGWEAIFYIWGVAGGAWCPLGLIWIFSTPDSHPSITDREKAYLQENLRERFPLPLDWVAIFLDPAAIAIMAAHFGFTFLFHSLLVNVTTYYMYAMNLSLSGEFIFILIAYVFVWPLAIVMGFIADFFIYHRGIKPIIFRKTYFAIASMLPAICIIVIVFMGCAKLQVFILVIVGTTLTALYYCSIIPNIYELTHNYPGFIFGTMNLFAGVILGAQPFSFIFIGSQNNTVTSWKWLAFFVGAVAAVDTLLFSVLGSSKRRLWDMTQPEKDFYNDQKAKEKAEKAKK